MRITRRALIHPAILTLTALVAFAANSVLCRLALRTQAIDAYGFTAIRVGSGAVTLVLLIALRRDAKVEHATPIRQRWMRAVQLLMYALPFSIAYVDLDTGTGALLLFGAVQLTMIGVGMLRGERPLVREWLGFAGAAAGVVYLVLPGVTAPDPIGAASMVVAGVGWGLYSIAGKGAGDPLRDTAESFARASVLLVPVVVVAFVQMRFSTRGVLLAAVSGALTSGVGYAIWYAAVKTLTATRAALVQLSVPVLAALGGVMLLGEVVTARLVVASAVILGSIAVAVMRR